MKTKYFILTGLFSCSLGLFFSTVPSKAQTDSVKYLDSRNKSSKTTDPKTLEIEVFNLINKTREANGLKKLVWSEQVAQVARLHSSNMANFNFFSHIGMDGKRVDDRADSLGVRKWQVIGENIAYNSGFSNPIERAVNGWMNSEGHRKNILRNNWTETGIGIAVSANGRFYVTQVFLKRK